MKNKIFSFIYLSIVILFFISVFILPADPRVVEVENRNLNIKPEITLISIKNGSFMESFDKYVSDIVYKRSYFIDFSNQFTNFLTSNPVLDNEIKETDLGGKVFITKNKIMEIFTKNKELELKYANVINQYRNELPSNVNIYSVLVPTQIEFQNDLYKTTSDSELDAINYVYSNYDNGIIPIDVYDNLKVNKDKYIYFRTDHHWTQLGSYYGYLAFCKSINLDPIKIDNYNQNQKNNFLGYLYNLVPTGNIEKNPDTINYYSPKFDLEISKQIYYYTNSNEKSTYELFLGGDYPIHEIETDSNSNKTLVVVKDSYANCFIPWLLPHYKKIVIIDPRTFEGSVKDEVLKYDNVDLLFLNYIFTTTFNDFIHSINNIK